MASSVTIKAVGLATQPNILELPPGSLTEAKNIIIKRDDVVESRRGYKLYGTSFGTTSDTASQLLTYKQRIIRHYADTLQFDTEVVNSAGESVFASFSGSFQDAEDGLRLKHIESNSNLYFTSSEGIKKISAKTADEFSTSSGYITQAGGIKALDLQPRLNYTFGSQTDFFTQDSVVAYRVVWGIKDANSNLILGSPSERAEIYNPLTPLMLQDFNRVLSALDAINQSGSLITDGNYVDTLKLTSASSSTDLLTNLQSLAAKLDNDIYFANSTGAGVPFTISSVTDLGSNVFRLNFAAGPTTADYFTVGDKIKLSGFTTTTGSINATQTITALTGSTLTFTNATVATGPVTVIGDVKSYAYESITVPSTPSIPATDGELVDIQNYLLAIITRLQSELIGVISSTLSNTYIIPLDVTKSSTVTLRITIPSAVTTNNFYQVYRTAVNSAELTTVLSDLSAGDEMGLVYEAFPTSTEISQGYLDVEDITTDSFRGANLYTNPSTGEGILQANEVPPFAKDINRFKNVIFYANCRTKHRKSLSLLGVTNMITDYNNSITPKLTISNGLVSNTYSFIVGLQEKTNLFTVADVADSLNGLYFNLNSANDVNKYYVWFKTSGGSVSDPSVSGRVGIRVDFATGATANAVATAVRNKLSEYLTDFTITGSTNTVTIENVDFGYTTDLDLATSTFTKTIVTQGQGEDAANKKVLLSNSVSPAIAVDETARSLVRVINSNPSESNYAFYTSGSTDVPGKFLIEARDLDTLPVYFLANNSVTGTSFNPELTPEGSITSISIANPTLITTSAPHGMIEGDQVVISSSDSTPSIDGLYTITYVSSTQFTIPVNVTGAGTSAVFSKAVDAEHSENEDKPNRIYYSKIQQPEAVPILNYIEVGAEDEPIYRIFPLRDSLFVFKAKGLYRISGETAPFNLALFDSSTNLLAPDSIGVANNIIYCWTSGGITSVTEAGPSVISRTIDVDILKLASSQYTNFKTATFGIGYESDNSYTVYTVKKTTDTVATIGYRFSTLTNSWTTVDKSCTCGFVNDVDDKMYLGVGDTNHIEQERKSFTRYDYADREFKTILTTGNYNSKQIRLSNVSNFAAGDVLVQDQTVNTFQFNMLLKKLDLDSGLVDNNYYTTLKVQGGADLRSSLVSLCDKLDADTGAVDTDYASSIATKTGTITSNSADTQTIITTPVAHGLFTGRVVSITGSNSVNTINDVFQVTVISPTTFSIPYKVSVAGSAGSWTTINTDFRDIKACYNHVISKLNADSGVSFSNYVMTTHNTPLEAVITDVNLNTKIITVNLALDYVLGDMTIYKAIETTFTYGPQSMGDILNFKHLSEATMMFINKAFTSAKLSFASDLLPKFIDINFNGDGNGIFGASTFGSGFFGGGSNAAPFRTYIPRNVQRCRYVSCKFTHKVAREQYGILGLTITGEITPSTRAYR